MSPQQQLGGEVEGIPVLASWMTRGDVQRLEVVPLGLDLWAELHHVTEAFEDRLDLALHLREYVDVAASEWWARERDVDRLCLGDVRQPCNFELCASGRQRRLDRALGLVGGLAQRRSLGGRHLADACQQPGYLPALPAQVIECDRLELVFSARLRNRGDCLFCQLSRSAHAARLRRTSNRSTAAA